MITSYITLKFYNQKEEPKPNSYCVSHHITFQWQTYISFSMTVIKKTKDALESLHQRTAMEYG